MYILHKGWATKNKTLITTLLMEITKQKERKWFEANQGTMMKLIREP